MNRYQLVGVLLLVLAVLLPILGAAGTVLGMITTFDRIAGATDTPSPDHLAEGISHAFFYAGVGIVVGLLSGIAGIVLLVLGRKKPSASGVPPDSVASNQANGT